MKVDLYCEDCVDRMRKMKEEGIKVDLTVTSPPYDDLRTYKGTNDDWNFDKFKEVADLLYDITADGGAVVWVVGDSTIKGSETLSSFRQAIYFKELGFNVETMIWDKGSFAFPSKNLYHQVFEYMFVLQKGPLKAKNFIIDRKNAYVGALGGTSGRNKDGVRNTGRDHVVRGEYGKRFNIWRYPIGGGHSSEDKEAYEHPAIFPEDLAKDHIISWSNEGDTIFDPFMGSGTTGKMAVLTGRNFIGIERVEEYYNISKNRIEKYNKD